MKRKMVFVFSVVLMSPYILMANVDILWSRTYGGNNGEEGYDVQPTEDGGYIMVGTTTSYGAGSWDLWLLKTDAAGDTLWTRTYGREQSDVGYGVKPTGDGGYIVIGYTQLSDNRDIWLLKTDALGDTLWSRTFGGSGSDYGKEVYPCNDGGYVIFGEMAYDFCLMKTNPVCTLGTACTFRLMFLAKSFFPSLAEMRMK